MTQQKTSSCEALKCLTLTLTQTADEPGLGFGFRFRLVRDFLVMARVRSGKIYEVLKKIEVRVCVRSHTSNIMMTKEKYVE